MTSSTPANPRRQDEPDHDFELRVSQGRRELLAALEGLYPDLEVVADRLVAIAERAHGERSAQLRALDDRRLADPQWFQRSSNLGYAAYADRFATNLAGVGAHVDYLAELGVTYLHLMPLLTPRPSPNDGGYAVADYRSVRSDLGTMDDLRELTDTLRDHGISLCLDLVLNHVAAEHPWAQAARAGDPAKRDYFYAYPDRTMPDAWEATLPEVFPEFAPGNFTFDEEFDAWVWTTFNTYQWDLNWANPDVLCEFADIIVSLANQGVEIFRLDAIAFLWKRLGTNCQNQPEVHRLTRALRAVTSIACPAVLFKAEAIVGPNDLPAYLGVGDNAGKVSQLAYHNALMVHIWSMLASSDTRLASHALERLPQPPVSTSWITYVRCHDDIGWAIDDGDAAALGMNGPAHRAFLSDWYSGDYPGSWARGLVFGANPNTGDKRISGTTASLLGYECKDPFAVRRIMLVHAIIFGFGGLPVLWMGDEFGLLNDPGWADEPAHADDNRWAHRPHMPWTGPKEVPDSDRIRENLKTLIHARSACEHLHAATPTEVWAPRDPGVLLVVRKHPDGPLLAAYNMTDRPARVPGEVFFWLGLDQRSVRNRLSDRELVFEGDELQLAAYQGVWITAS